MTLQHPSLARRVWATLFSLAATRRIPKPRSLYPIDGTETEINVLVSFPLGTEMFYFPRFAYGAHAPHSLLAQRGFPHSDISGS